MIPKSLIFIAACVLADVVAAQDVTAPTYQRQYFGVWSDEDHDCMNTRHDMLSSLSTGRTTLSEDGCRVMRGRWLDPYTGQLFFDASDLDIDHVVPLYWAWERGAWSWPIEKLVKFGNDPRNLEAVDDATNNAKGSRSPLDWLPPEPSYRCQYVLRFLRLIIIYEIDVPNDEMNELELLKTELCG